MKKTLRYLLLAVLVAVFVLPVLPVSAEANYSRMNTALKEKLQAGDELIPVTLAYHEDYSVLGQGLVAFYSWGNPNKLMPTPLWLYAGTVEEWWAEIDRARTEWAKEEFGGYFDALGYDYDAITYNPATGSYLLTPEQIFALRDFEDVFELSLFYIEPANESADDKLEYFSVTAADALEILQKVVSNKNVTDYDRDGKSTSGDALVVLQMAVGKRRAANPRETFNVTQ